MSFHNISFLILTLGVAMACGGGTGDDLVPSSKDLREPNASSATTAGMFIGTAVDTQGLVVDLDSEVASHKATLLYFTMWCPICESHMSDIRRTLVPTYPNVRILLVDYVSSDTASSSSAQMSSGFGDLWTLVDVDGKLENRFSGTMSSAVVLDSGGNVMLNEDYKDGQRVREALTRLNEP